MHERAMCSSLVSIAIGVAVEIAGILQGMGQMYHNGVTVWNTHMQVSMNVAKQIPSRL